MKVVIKGEPDVEAVLREFSARERTLVENFRLRLTREQEKQLRDIVSSSHEKVCLYAPQLRNSLAATPRFGLK